MRPNNNKADITLCPGAAPGELLSVHVLLAMQPIIGKHDVIQ